MKQSDFLLWSFTKDTIKAEIAAALRAVARRGWQPERILFNTGEQPDLETQPGISIEEANNVTPRHFQVWPKKGL